MGFNSGFKGLNLVASADEATREVRKLRSALSCMVRGSGRSLLTFRHNLSFPFFESQSVQGPVGCPEISVNYRSMLRNIPEEPRSDSHRRGSPTSRTARKYCIVMYFYLVQISYI